MVSEKDYNYSINDLIASSESTSFDYGDTSCIPNDPSIGINNVPLLPVFPTKTSRFFRLFNIIMLFTPVLFKYYPFIRYLIFLQ